MVAPEGTVAMIKELETTVKAAEVPLKLTLVAPVRSVPKISTNAPAGPESTYNGGITTGGCPPFRGCGVVYKLAETFFSANRTRVYERSHARPLFGF
jgi:hypothetical protein